MTGVVSAAAGTRRAHAAAAPGPAFLMISNRPRARAPLPPPQIYCLPELDLMTSGCRLTLPGRAVSAGGRGGWMLAAGGDDGVIKVVDLAADNKVGPRHHMAGRHAACAVRRVARP